MANLVVGQTVIGSPGDEFTFTPPSNTTQYHFEIGTPDKNLTIGLWKDSHVAGHGVARNKLGKNYVDHACGTGQFVLSVEGATRTYVVKVTANSWFKKVFGF